MTGSPTLRSLALTIAGFCALTGCGHKSTDTSHANASAGSLGKHYANVSGKGAGNAQLVSPVPAGEWRLPNGDLANTRYSTLDKINVGNVAGLKVVSTMATGIPHGHEGNPLVVNGTMYVVTPYPNDVLAIDLTKPHGPLKWKYSPNP